MCQCHFNFSKENNKFYFGLKKRIKNVTILDCNMNNSKTCETFQYTWNNETSTLFSANILKRFKQLTLKLKMSCVSLILKIRMYGCLYFDCPIRDCGQFK